MKVATFTIALVAIGVLTASTAAAQTFDSARRTVLTSIHHSVPPFATLTEMWAFGRRWSVNGFYAVRDRSRGPDESWHWVVRSTWGNMHGDGGVRWADSRSCPALLSALENLNSLSLVRPEVQGLHGAGSAPPLDGASFTFNQRWARDGGGALVSAEVTGNVDTLLGKWWMSADQALTDCWSEAEPVH